MRYTLPVLGPVLAVNMTAAVILAALAIAVLAVGAYHWGRRS